MPVNPQTEGAEKCRQVVNASITRYIKLLFLSNLCYPQSDSFLTRLNNWCLASNEPCAVATS